MGKEERRLDADRITVTQCIPQRTALEIWLFLFSSYQNIAQGSIEAARVGVNQTNALGRVFASHLCRSGQTHRFYLLERHDTEPLNQSHISHGEF